jgi:hypothetical protein
MKPERHEYNEKGLEKHTLSYKLNGAFDVWRRTGLNLSNGSLCKYEGRKEFDEMLGYKENW